VAHHEDEHNTMHGVLDMLVENGLPASGILGRVGRSLAKLTAAGDVIFIRRISTGSRD
jgi:hypothetical protein